jgi:hypothetical protein
MRSDELLFFIGRGYISAVRYTSAAHLLRKNTNRDKAISKSKKTIHGKAISVSKKTIHGKAISIVKIIKIISLTALQKAEFMIK